MTREGVPVVRIGGGKRWLGEDLRAVWDYRELLYFLTWRDIKVRYKQASLGVLWAIGQPLMTMALMTLIFGVLAKIPPPEGMPYALFCFSGLVPFQFFTRSFSGAAGSLVASQGLITKVYFPRLAVPLSSVLAALVDFAISCAILFALMLIYGVAPGLPILALPAYLLLVLLAGLAVGLWFAALNVQYRDVGQLVPFLTTAWMYLTPVMYPGTLVEQQMGAKVRLLYSLNPMVGITEGFRWSLLGQGEIDLPALAASVVVTAALLATGLAYFRRTEKVFADVV